MENYISRPFFCENHQIHRQAKHYLVWAGTRKILVWYEIEKRIKVKSGITPHLISLQAISLDRKIITVGVTCGIVGCGVHFNDPKTKLDGYLNQIKSVELDIKDWNALVLFKDTGYEL